MIATQNRIESILQLQVAKVGNTSLGYSKNTWVILRVLEAQHSQNNSHELSGIEMFSRPNMIF